MRASQAQRSAERHGFGTPLGPSGETKDWKLPHLDDLQIEVRTLYEKSGLNPGEKGPYRTTVELKKLAGLVSHKLKKKEVTKERVQSKTFSFAHLLYFIFVQS